MTSQVRPPAPRLVLYSLIVGSFVILLTAMVI